MNMCRFVNKIYKMIDYCIDGPDEEYLINKCEYDLTEVIEALVLGVLYIIVAVWWLAPLQYIKSKITINPNLNIKFKCDK